MSTTITLEEAATTLREVIARLAPGDEVLITKDQKTVARLTGEKSTDRRPRVPGNCMGMITLLVEDDEHLKDFAEYMP